MQSGDRVRVRHPEYATGETGIILEQEILRDGSRTGYWLVQIEGKEMILAQLPHELELLR